MEPMEVIDLSSDDETSPLKVEEKMTAKVEKIEKNNSTMKKEVINKNNRSDKEDVEVICNIIRSVKRADRSTDGSNCLTKKMKLSDNSPTSKCIIPKTGSLSEDRSKTDEKSKNGTLINQADETQRQKTLQRSSPRHLAFGNEIIADVKSGSKETKIIKDRAHSKDNDDDDVSHLKNKVKTSSSVGKSSRSLDNGESSSSFKRLQPQLIVKSRVRVSETSEEGVLAPIREMFQSFSDACFNRDPSSDMKEILRRMRKRFDNLEPGFAKSESFMYLIRNKRDLVTNNASDTYRHMLEVRDEMKARQITHNAVITYENGGEGEPSGSGLMDKQSEAETIKDSKTDQMLRLLDKAMIRCQRYINKCETAEVNFEDENDSYYIMAEKYKKRMVELYNKRCEITGNKPDAARPYLRPKNFTVTPLPLLNNAIASFINTKMTKMNKSKGTKKENRSKSFAEALIFPDYVDILNCVQKCNTEQNLQLTKRKEREIAKQAFTDLGEHLQICRKRDYYDTFSLYLEQGYQDPASADEALAKQLRENEEIGKKKLNEVFEEFVIKQNAIAEKATANLNAATESEEERSDKSSHDTDSNSGDSDNESYSPESDGDSSKNKNNDSSTRLRSDTPRESGGDNEPDKRSEKNNPKETNVASNVRICVDDGVSIPPEKKTEEKEKDSDASKTGNEESKENIETSTVDDTQRNKDNGISIQRKETEEKKRLTKTTAVSPSNNEECDLAPILIPIQEPTFAPVATKDTAKQTSDKSDVKLASDNLATMPAKNIEVIVNDDVEKKPILRPRSFAKPPAHWKDFQMPASGLIANTETDITTGGGDTVLTEVVKLSADKDKQLKLMKLTSLSAGQKTIQVKADVGDSISRKITLKIPSSIILGKNNPKVNVRSVTNNITVVNIGNRSEFNPKITSVFSCGPKAPKTAEKGGEDKTVTTQSDKRATNVAFNEGKSPGRVNANIRVATSNNKQAPPVEKPVNQPSEQANRLTHHTSPQRQYRILSPKNISSQIQIPNILTTPVRDKNGKVVVYQMIKNMQAGSKTRKIFVPKTAVSSETSHGQNQRPGNNLPSPVTDSRSKSQVQQSNNNRTFCPIKVPKLSSNRMIKQRDGSIHSVPTYVIE